MSSTEILFLEILKSNSIDKENNPNCFIDDSNKLLNTYQIVKEDFKIGVMKFFSNNNSEYQIGVHITKDNQTATNLLRKRYKNESEADDYFKELVSIIENITLEEILLKFKNYYL